MPTTKAKRGIPAAAWFYSQSFHGNITSSLESGGSSQPNTTSFPCSRETCSFEAKNVFELAAHISSHDLRVNHRVKFREDSIEGTVIDVGYSAITVQWDDGQVGQISLCDFPRSVEVV